MQGRGRAEPTPVSANRVTFCRNCASQVSCAFECPPLAFPRNKDDAIEGKSAFRKKPTRLVSFFASVTSDDGHDENRSVMSSRARTRPFYEGLGSRVRSDHMAREHSREHARGRRGSFRWQLVGTFSS